MDVDDNILAYCIVGQLRKPTTVFEEHEDEARPLLTFIELMEPRASDVLFQNSKEILKKDETATVNKDGLSYRKTPTNRAIQIGVCKWYRKTLLYHRHCPTLAGHPGTRGMYNVFKVTYYWSHMASKLHQFGFRCETWRQHRPSKKQQRWLRLFPPSEPLVFVAINILGPLT